ncbi:MAG: hypothetical protein NTY46_02055 [Candidatus Sumerlaeota bacterium]|nr:hypothetical protein [Candidatus Sumerlaeota bacterium]
MRTRAIGIHPVFFLPQRQSWNNWSGYPVVFAPAEPADATLIFKHIMTIFSLRGIRIFDY